MTNSFYYVISCILLLGIISIVYMFMVQRRKSHQRTSQEFTKQYQLFDEQGQPTENSSSLATEPALVNGGSPDSLLTSLEIPQREPTIQEKPSIKAEPVPIIAINILATGADQFVGYELLQAILSSGMRFGSMNIFHRYEQLNGKGNTLFSLVSATEPGTFDLSDIGGFACKGLTLFLHLDNTPNLSSNFELMLGTARQLAQDLGGELFDEQRQPLTDQTIRHYRERIRNCL